MESVQKKGPWWLCCCAPVEEDLPVRPADERSALIDHTATDIFRNTHGKHRAPRMDNGSIQRAPHSPPGTSNPPSRPLTPDSAYGDGGVSHGTITDEVSPIKVGYGTMKGNL